VKKFTQAITWMMKVLLGACVWGCLPKGCLPNDILWHRKNPLWQIGNTGVESLTYQSKLHLTEKGLTTNGRIYNLSQPQMRQEQADTAAVA